MHEGVLMGPGSSAAVADFVYPKGREAGAARPMILVGAAFASRPWAAALQAALGPLKPTWVSQQGQVTPRGVAELAGRLHAGRTRVLVGIGGGSVIDAAKAAARLAGIEGADERTVIEACLGRIVPPPSPVRLLVLPTTPGTGAEVTPFATIWDQAGNRKLSLTDRGVRPSAAILDPDLVRGLGAYHVCGSILDTLCQAAEAAWSVRATASSTSLGLSALALVGPLLDEVDPAALHARERQVLQLAGHLSGQAIAEAPTSSCHAVSYPLTLREGLAHGHACATAFGSLLRYNAGVRRADCADPRGPGRVRAVVDRIAGALGASDVEGAAARVEAFMTRHGLVGLDEIPIDPTTLAREALAYPRCSDNPRVLTTEVLARLLDRQPVPAGVLRCA